MSKEYVAALLREQEANEANLRLAEQTLEDADGDVETAAAKGEVERRKSRVDAVKAELARLRRQSKAPARRAQTRD